MKKGVESMTRCCSSSIALFFVLLLFTGCSSGLGRAKKYMDKGENKKAIEFLTNVVESDEVEEKAEAYFLLGKAQYAEKDYLAASRSLAKSRSLGLEIKADEKDAHSIIQATWGIVTNNAIVKYNDAIGAIRDGDRIKANVLLDTAKMNADMSVEMQPDSALGYTILGNILVLKEDYFAAAEAVKKGIENNPTNQEGYIQLSNIYTQHLADKDSTLKLEAIRVLEVAMEKTEETPALIRQLTVAYIANGRASDAENVAKKMVEQEGNNKFSHFLYGIALGELGKYDKSLASYRKALKIDPEFEEVVYNFAFISFNKADKDYNKNADEFFEEQKAEIEKVKSKRKRKKLIDDIKPYTGHHSIIDEAIEVLSPVALKVKKSDYLDLLARLYAKKGDNQKAEEIFGMYNESIQDGSNSSNTEEMPEEQ